MKTRTGFVSNSSTTHFVALGWQLDDDDVRDYIKKVHPDWLAGKDGIGRHTILGMLKDISRFEPIIDRDGVILGKMLGSSDQDGDLESLSGIELTSEKVKEVEEIGKQYGYRRPKLIFGSWSSD